MRKEKTVQVPVATQEQTSDRQSKNSARSQAILELRKIHKSYRVGKNDIPVLKDINLAIYPGEFLIILGPSGSGKSTLLNHILGLEMPTSGSIFISGINITAFSANKIAKLRHQHFGIVFQRPDWIHSINVVQNVSLPLAIHNVGRAERLTRAMEELKKAEVADFASYAPMDLSGGQQQKVALARALINDPQIVIADEPTGNLDSVSADKVMEHFRQLHEEQGKTILMVTHNTEYVRYGMRTISLRDGCVVEAEPQPVRTSS